MNATASKPVTEESILAAFTEREKKLAQLRHARKATPMAWIFIVGAWLATAWAFHKGEIRFSEFMVMNVLLAALVSCFRDYQTRLQILSDHLIAELHSQPLVAPGRTSSISK